MKVLWSFKKSAVISPKLSGKTDPGHLLVMLSIWNWWHFSWNICYCFVMTAVVMRHTGQPSSWKRTRRGSAQRISWLITQCWRRRRISRRHCATHARSVTTLHSCFSRPTHHMTSCCQHMTVQPASATSRPECSHTGDWRTNKPFCVCSLVFNNNRNICLGAFFAEQPGFY